MNIKILKDNGTDRSAARTVSNMLLNNYKKELAISNNEVAEESGISSSERVDPTEYVQMRNQKTYAIDGLTFSKGYKVKAINATDVSKAAVSASSQQVKEFMAQSKTLDNELDHVLAQMNLENKEEFYGGGFNAKEKHHFKNDATHEEMNNILDTLIDQLAQEKAIE